MISYKMTTDTAEISLYKVISKDGDIYTLMAEYFKHDCGGFAFYINKQKVAWFDFEIVKAVFVINAEGTRNES